MLPEKRKRLTIAAICFVVAIIVVLILAKISSFIKNRDTQNKKNNDVYSEIYDYIGVTIDKDGIYKLYGINKKEEKYLEVKTFYEVKDMININKKLVLYSDAVNEIRYDKKAGEFYFYELDNFYNKYDNVKLTPTYLLVEDADGIKYRKYGTESFENISKYSEYLINDNKIYFVKEFSIYVFDLETKKEDLVVSYNMEYSINLLAINNEFVIFTRNNKLNIYNIESGSIYEKDDTFYSTSKDGYITIIDGNITNYSLLRGDYTYKYGIDSTVNNIIYLENNTFYLSYDKNYAIIDLEKGDIWKSLENEYIYLMKVN